MILVSEVPLNRPAWDAALYKTHKMHKRAWRFGLGRRKAALLSASVRIWHITDSQGQILVLAFK